MNLSQCVVLSSTHVLKVSKRAKWVYTRESNHGLKTGAVLRLVSHGWPVSIGHNPAWSLVVTFMILQIFWNRIVNKCTYFLSSLSPRCSTWHWVKASLMVSISSRVQYVIKLLLSSLSKRSSEHENLWFWLLLAASSNFLSFFPSKLNQVLDLVFLISEEELEKKNSRVRIRHCSSGVIVESVMSPSFGHPSTSNK